MSRDPVTPASQTPMNLRLYDTAQGRVVPVVQRDAGKLSFYSCGPTVYDLPHLGHGRMVLTYDVFRRFVMSRGVTVHHVSNITDIEDKIIDRAKVSGESFDAITSRYEAEWYAAMDRLNVLRPQDDPHATAYVEQMTNLISALIDKGVAYETSDSVYFSPESVADYGLLARQSIDSLKAGARVEQDAHKRSPVDFALWKKIDPMSGEPTWPSPWGPGRPGWHTECVVMSLDILGDGFDIHAGGLDLAFPHHENERAQAVAVGKQFARHWMHNGFVEMGGEKMSKSLGNFTSLVDLLDKYDPRAYRLLVLRSHYRSPIEVVPDTIEDAEKGVARIDDFVRRFPEALDDGAVDEELIDAFNREMEDDLDTPAALALVFNAVREANADKDQGGADSATTKARTVVTLLRAVGLDVRTGTSGDDEATQMVKARDEARARKDWVMADEMRVSLEALGWTVQDTAEGTRIHK